MKTNYYLTKSFILFTFLIFILCDTVFSQNIRSNPELDRKVETFLNNHRYSWHDLNIPESDGELLFNLIVDNGYTKALEIGTSTGHSGIWIAWALSKTGGKLITIEIEEDRYLEALGHFEEAGLSEYIDARLGDAHEIVPQLEGPFDFIFSDADKTWYENYFIDLAPKMEVGGCFTAHNVTRTRRQVGISKFVDAIEERDNFETTYDYSGGGVSISFKINED